LWIPFEAFAFESLWILALPVMYANISPQIASAVILSGVWMSAVKWLYDFASESDVIDDEFDGAGMSLCPVEPAASRSRSCEFPPSPSIHPSIVLCMRPFIHPSGSHLSDPISTSHLHQFCFSPPCPYIAFCE